MKFFKSFFFFILIFGFSSYTYAQIEKNIVNLSIYLKQIESKHEVIFSYADKEIEFVGVLNKSFKSFEEYLKYLKIYTPFEYVVQDNNNILLLPLPYQELICIKALNKMTKDAVKEIHISTEKYIYKSNSSGIVQLPVNADWTAANIHADDYISETIEVNRTKECFVVELRPFYLALNEVFLTNLLTRGISKVASGGLEINYREFGLLPGLVEPDVLQSLQALPGIVSRNESVSYLNVRGGTHDQNLFLWDGIKMYSTSHFFGMISAFNPYMTEEITLVKSGTSARYGDGVSSLIDMRTKNTIADSLRSNIGINFINADALISVPVNKNSSVEFSSRYSINNLWESPTYDRYFDKVFQNTEVTDFETTSFQQNNDFNFFDATLAYKYQLSDKDFLKINLLYAEDDFNLNRFDLENQLIETRSSSLSKTNLAGGLFYERKWTKSTTSQLQVYTSQYGLESENTNLLNQQNLEQKNNVDEFGLKVNLQTSFFEKFRLEGGYQFTETGILNSQRVNDPGFFRETQNAIVSNALYAQVSYLSENKKLNFSLGSRLNHYSKFNEYIIEPRLNLSYEIFDDFFVELLAEEKSQVTSQTIDLQTDFLGVENRRWVLSIPGIRPVIESQQISTGLNFIKPKWFINLDFYYKNVDGITTQGQGFQNQFEFSQTHGSYTVKGFDVLINKNFEPFSGWVSYSLSENNYTFNELVPSIFLNNLDIRHVISTGLSFEKKGLKISSGFNWHSGATTTLLSEDQDNLPQSIQYQHPNTARLTDYFRFDVSSTYTFKVKNNIKSVVGLSFLNLLDNQNVYNQFYLINAEQNIATFRQNGLGFTPNLMLRFIF